MNHGKTEPGCETYAGRVLLRCTVRMMKLLGRRAGQLADVEPGEDDWYANVFTIDRRKCLLLH